MLAFRSSEGLISWILVASVAALLDVEGATAVPARGDVPELVMDGTVKVPGLGLQFIFEYSDVTDTTFEGPPLDATDVLLLVGIGLGLGLGPASCSASTSPEAREFFPLKSDGLINKGVLGFVVDLSLPGAGFDMEYLLLLEYIESIDNILAGSTPSDPIRELGINERVINFFKLKKYIYISMV